MVNKNADKLIRFPISSWIADVNQFQGDLPSSSYCLCYQYNIDDNGYGPYGFSTELSAGLLGFIFPNLMFYDATFEKLESCSNINNKGTYLYGELCNEFNELKKYNLLRIKNKLRTNKGMETITLPEEPLILKLHDERFVNVNLINDLLQKGCFVSFSCFLTPMAGQTIVLFDDSVLIRAQQYCENHNILFIEADSIDELKSW